MNSIPAMSNEARVWLFAVKDGLSVSQVDGISKGLAEYVASWTAHKQAVQGAFEIRYKRFLVLAAEKGFEQVSGCSIDKMFSTVRAVTNQNGAELADPATVFYRAKDEIRECDRASFRSLAAKGEVDSDTIVFNLLVQKLADYQAGNWEVPAAKSWHKQLFPAAAA